MLFCNCCSYLYPCNPQNNTLTSTGHSLPTSIGLCNATEESLCEEQDTRSSNEFLRECEEQCKPPCSEAHYDMPISSANWPSLNNLETYGKTLRASHTHKDIYDTEPFPSAWAVILGIYNMEVRSMLLKLTVYLETLEVDIETQSPKYEWSSFLSSIGGVMGLFTGFSILSFFEIVELLIDLCSHMASIFSSCAVVTPELTA